MPTINRRDLLLAGMAAGAGVDALESRPAAASAPPRQPTLFEQAIPRPTGRNGYEELVMAADQLAASRRYQEAGKAEAGAAPTLALKRRVLADSPVDRALSLLRKGLSKPVSFPRLPITNGTTFLEMSGFRDLARLLRMQTYVQLADGRVGQGLDSVELCLRLGEALQRDSLFSSLVGLAISAIGAAAAGARLEQLGASDCERLYRICLERLAAGDPLPRILEAERQIGKDELARIRSKGAGPLEERLIPPSIDPDTGEVGPGEPDEEARRLIAEIRRTTSSPGGLDALLSQIDRRLDGQYDRVLEMLKRPPWQRSWDGFDENDPSLPGKLAADMGPPMSGTASDAYTRAAERMRLLAVHAVIFHFRWEHDRLPTTLSSLDLGDLAVDLFSGQPLKYEVTGRRYRLWSIGAETIPEDPAAVDGRRLLSVIPGD
jgi:hypothetical protein